MKDCRHAVDPVFVVTHDGDPVLLLHLADHTGDSLIIVPAVGFPIKGDGSFLAEGADVQEGFQIVLQSLFLEAHQSITS